MTTYQNEWTTTGRPMSRLSQRFWNGVGERLVGSGALDALLIAPGSASGEAERLAGYAARWVYYNNKNVYKVLRRRTAQSAMPTEWNPVPSVVAFYVSNVMAGNMAIQPGETAPDPDALAAAVEVIWAWSNFTALKRSVTLTAAVTGDVFVKVAERRSMGDEGQSDSGQATTVYMQVIDPAAVRWWEADEREYLTGIRIDTPRLQSVFTGIDRRHILVEVWSKVSPNGDVGGVRYYEVAADKVTPDDQLGTPIAAVSFSELGYDFIPITWARVDTYWYQQTAGIDRYNETAWQQARLNRPLAIVNANATDAQGRPLAAPSGIAGGMEALYTEGGDGVIGVVEMPGTSTLTWSGNPTNFDAINNRLDAIRAGVIDSLPEYRVATLQGIQISSETLTILLNQAEQRVLEMRDSLERTLIRAQMMALSVAQAAALEPEVFAPSVIGEFATGALDHVFKPRPVFPKTATARAMEAGLHIDNGLSIEAAYALAGYSEEDVNVAIQADTTVVEQ